MSTFKEILFLTFFFILSSSILGQNTRLVVYFDTLNNTYPRHILIGYAKDTTITGLIIKSDTANFEYRGRIIDNLKNEYIVFDYFSDAVGYTCLYLFSTKEFEIFSSEAILENEIPILFSFNKSTLVMWKVSVLSPNCGEKSILGFKPMTIKKYNRDEIKAYKKYLAIDLQ
jgi:hypothetical protein